MTTFTPNSRTRRTWNRLWASFTLTVWCFFCTSGAQAQSAPKISTWEPNTADWNQNLGITGMRIGCSQAPNICETWLNVIPSTQQNVGPLFLSIRMDPTTSVPYAEQLSQWSVSNPSVVEVGFDDFVNRIEHLMIDGVKDPGALMDQVITAVKSGNPKLKFGITFYEEQFDSAVMTSVVPASVLARIDFVHLYVHYRMDGPNYAQYVQRAKSAFPNATIIAGAYALDRIDYLPCQRGTTVKCTLQQEEDLFKQLLQIQLDMLKQGEVLWLEFFPGYFGMEDLWPEWKTNPRLCVNRFAECIANTQAIRQIALQELNNAFSKNPPPASPLLSVSNIAVGMGSSPVGVTTGPQSLLVKSSGVLPLSISGISTTGPSGNDFSQSNTCENSLAPGTGCSVALTFTPSTAGTRLAELQISDNAPGSPHRVALSGSGTGSASGPVVSFSPASLSFNAQAVGTASGSQSLTLNNIGSSALSISGIALAGANASDFSETNACGNSVASGATCTISVVFTPSASGARSGQLQISDNAPASPQVIPLSGTGVAAANPPVASLSSTALSFGSQAVGTASAAQAVTLSNTGGLALAITAIAIGGANASDFSQTNTCGNSVAAGTNCSISVKFAPSASGARSAQLRISDNATGSPQVIAVSGTGETGASAPVVSLSATSLNFGNQNVGTTSSPSPITLSNTGGSALNIGNVTVGGSNGSDFSEDNTCGNSVAAGTSCSFNVKFGPTAEGARTAQLQISDNAAGSPHLVALSGTGQTPQSADFTIAATPASATISAGQTATFTATLGPSGGFSQPVSLACAGAPPAGSCSVSPGSVALNGVASVTASITLTTTARGASPMGFRWPVPMTLRPVTFCVMAIGMLLVWRRNRAPWVGQAIYGYGAVAILAALTMAGCGGATVSSNPKRGATGTAAGTYTLSVTGNSGTLAHTATVQVVVN